MLLGVLSPLQLRLQLSERKMERRAWQKEDEAKGKEEGGKENVITSLYLSFLNST
jgi:hypothetical protein